VHRGCLKWIYAQICQGVHVCCLLKVAVSSQVSNVFSSFGYLFSCAIFGYSSITEATYKIVLLKQLTKLFVHYL
jgi:hypothetical protein